MAVTLDVSDLIQPIGELDATFFPDGNLDTYLPGWLTQAEIVVSGAASIVEEDAAAAAYVYARAFHFLATRYNTLATTTDISGEITRTIHDEQIEYYLAQASKWADRYAAYVQGQTEVEIIAISVAPRFLFTVS